ncbi:DUF6892 domain-containing protein [Micromonospora sagamiensis]|uniref:DUF6892 domain-containing protein n=1 Tax=Micromonospora sagamiensis TaxID=47875 RepID=A0A562WKK9_9ACTN|nr:hypothetical protein [Micromonospora sagamiensis]TWJ30064.1 hypothetical protein JD81_03600 [Micromonospora sagamiensis]BCL16906.1 hypothetical protein GCM10017556_46450 [Micromonospora sagamiensis]
MTIVFADRGLHLGVLNALLTNGVIAAADLGAIVESTGPDGPDDGYPGPGPRLAASLDLLHAVTVPSAAAAAISHLDFDGGNEIYMLVEQTLDIDTGGESDDYNVTSLEGIQALSGLQSLDLDGHGYHPEPLDLTPLTGHPTLSELFLTGDCTGAGALESLPALRNLDITLAHLDDPDVPTRLEARGVTVHHRGRR